MAERRPNEERSRAFEENTEARQENTRARRSSNTVKWIVTGAFLLMAMAVFVLFALSYSKQTLVATFVYSENPELVREFAGSEEFIEKFGCSLGIQDETFHFQVCHRDDMFFCYLENKQNMTTTSLIFDVDEQGSVEPSFYHKILNGDDVIVAYDERGIRVSPSVNLELAGLLVSDMRTHYNFCRKMFVKLDQKMLY
ncbi:hypothetical protein COT97_03515 [Candidatus Falkowbacteria bacterium CG10_big_fil_rev_8_21_14_0_10_39_11]|uniref:Uncharacterized protein n=1 Tax=Candidatus Falkowbacteria bacterium CG10_big_fil_rev_8_21_14_0_10_39_11 TaxID=1974565 RepID=A0A2H0V4I5_9BACT|nr:MAG: hypothetical protein COT97_03515 [Candidatus Falkowbacteria bacterium CG10_big_fil_rev_8_21_14_0_10_39_11]